MESNINGYAELILAVSLLIYTSFAVWLIVSCKHLIYGVFVTAAAIVGGYVICRYAAYIALAVIWAIRFAAVVAILAFILGFFPKSGRYPQTD